MIRKVRKVLSSDAFPTDMNIDRGHTNDGLSINHEYSNNECWAVHQI